MKLAVVVDSWDKKVDTFENNEYMFEVKDGVLLVKTVAGSLVAAYRQWDKVVPIWK